MSLSCEERREGRLLALDRLMLWRTPMKRRAFSSFSEGTFLDRTFCLFILTLYGYHTTVTRVVFLFSLHLGQEFLFEPHDPGTVYAELKSTKWITHLQQDLEKEPHIRGRIFRAKRWNWYLGENRKRNCTEICGFFPFYFYFCALSKKVSSFSVIPTSRHVDIVEYLVVRYIEPIRHNARKSDGDADLRYSHILNGMGFVYIFLLFL